MHSREVILAVVLISFLTSCEGDFKSKNNGKFECVVRVHLAWDNVKSRIAREEVIKQFSNNSISQSKGNDSVGFLLNNNVELMHLNFNNDERCTDKYKATEVLLNKYLEPINKSPKYFIHKKELLNDEFKGLVAKY
jgi:hypothetical protein